MSKLSWGITHARRAKVILLALLFDANNQQPKFYHTYNQPGEESQFYRVYFRINSSEFMEFIDSNKTEISKQVKCNDYFENSIPKENDISRHFQRMIEIGLFEKVPKQKGKNLWEITLKLEYDKKHICNNLIYLCKQWNKNSPKKSKKIPEECEDKLDKSTSTIDTYKSINKFTDQSKINDAVIILRDFDCSRQGEVIKDNQDKGIFFIRAKKDIRLWLIWRLGVYIPGFSTGMKIQLKCKNFKKSNDLWIELDNYISKNNYTIEWEKSPGNTHNTESEQISHKVINELVILLQTQTVIIIVFDFDILGNDGVLKGLYDLCNKLCDESLNKNTIKKLFIFLCEDISMSYQKCREIKHEYADIELKEIPKNEITDWFTTNQNKYSERHYRWEHKNNIIAEYENARSQLDIRELINDICVHVFELDEGIAEIEHNWGTTA